MEKQKKGLSLTEHSGENRKFILDSIFAGGKRNRGKKKKRPDNSFPSNGGKKNHMLFARSTS